jgi:hypothetical protein
VQFTSLEIKCIHEVAQFYQAFPRAANNAAPTTTTRSPNAGDTIR